MLYDLRCTYETNCSYHMTRYIYSQPHKNDDKHKMFSFFFFNDRSNHLMLIQQISDIPFMNASFIAFQTVYQANRTV